MASTKPNHFPSEKLYSKLRKLLIERLNDKESSVRLNAAIALSKLYGGEDTAELDQGPSITQHLIQRMSGDPSSYAFDL